MKPAGQQFDAIVIGSGISGGWAAKELTEKGLKTLLIERGRNVVHPKDYPTANLYPWELPHRGTLPLDIQNQYKSIGKHYSLKEDTVHYFLKDEEQEWIAEKPYSWIRGNQVGGRSLLWARQTQRWSDYDFEGPLRDGFAVDWPIRYNDLAPWYSYVEKYVGVSGNRDGLDVLPDGEFLPPFELTCTEKYFGEKVSENYKDRHVVIGRTANLSEAKSEHLEQGRSQCQRRDLCLRGCPLGGYFSSNSATIPAAQRTGNLTLLTNTVAESVLYDDEQGKATGVRVINIKTREHSEYHAKLIFVNGSTINTNLVLLNSRSERFPSGLGNDNGLLGTHIAFHSYRGRVSASYHGLLHYTTNGRRPTGAYMPRFRNVYQQETDFIRGYAASIYTWRMNQVREARYGAGLREELDAPTLGDWGINAQMMGETIPKESNSVRLDDVKKDKYGIPQLRISVEYDENDEKMLLDFYDQLTEMFTKAGFENIRTSDSNRLPGNENHEMGGVRMGHDPATSMLNKWNQLHGCKNVYVTDGACMTSTSTQNPSLTYMAITARAVNHAIDEFKAS